MKKAIVYSAIVKNSNVQVKAYSKEDAIVYLQTLDSSITADKVRKTNIVNSHQAVIGQN